MSQSVSGVICMRQAPNHRTIYGYKYRITQPSLPGALCTDNRTPARLYTYMYSQYILYTDCIENVILIYIKSFNMALN